MFSNSRMPNCQDRTIQCLEKLPVNSGLKSKDVTPNTTLNSHSLTAKFAYTCKIDGMYTCVHLHTLAYTCVHLRTLAYTCVHLRTLAYTCIHLHTLAYTCVHLHTLAYTCIHLRTLARSTVKILGDEFYICFSWAAGVSVMITIFGHFCYFSVKKLHFSCHDNFFGRN
jgi:hypothetical protein